MESTARRDRIEEGRHSTTPQGSGGKIIPFFVNGEHWRDRWVGGEAKSTLIRVYVGEINFYEDLNDDEEMERQYVLVKFRKVKKEGRRKKHIGGNYLVYNDNINFFSSNDKRIKKTKNGKLYIDEINIREKEQKYTPVPQW
tara:strand:+ start:54314 stop:54736 length:423 start_codon:yes stop_codon:yes gene_type:complete